MPTAYEARQGISSWLHHDPDAHVLAQQYEALRLKLFAAFPNVDWEDDSDERTDPAELAIQQWLTWWIWGN